VVELARNHRGVVRVTLALILLLVSGASAARAQAPLTYTPEQPPQQALYRDGWTNRYLLDGTWLLRFDYSDQGVSQGWWKNVAATDGWAPVQIPNAYNAGDFSQQSMLGYVGWYRKDFLLPRGPRKRVWIVRFESVDFRAQVWLNGHLIGTHTGDSLPFELYLSHVHAGVNRLIVRVDNRRSPTDIPSGLARGSWTYGGIVREVYLRPVLRADLAQAIVRPILPCPTCAATIQETAVVRNVTGAPQRVRLRGSFGKVPVDFGKATIAPYSSWTAQASVRIAHPRLWSIYQPALYRATLDLYGGSGGKQRLNTYVTYSGIRSIKLTPGGLLELNGRVVRLRGAFVQESDLVLGSALDPGHLQRLISWLRALGAHLIRSHDPLNPQILEMADQYGMLVWSEIPVTHELSRYLVQPAVSARALQLLRQNILTYENHPSVMLWSIGNELATPTPGQVAGYIASAAALAHSIDPTRPVGMAISDWPGLACQAAYVPLDALGFNDYFGWFDAGAGATDDRDQLSPFLDSFRACYPTKALFVTEFGFDANRNGPVEERGTYQFQANSAAFHLGVFATKPWLAGAVYFVLQDFASSPQYAGGNPWPAPPFNQKGLVDATGNFKPAFTVVSALYHGTGQLGASLRTQVRHGG
jgi:beta-glucuronidase